MKKKAMLHELIGMAKSGKKFRAWILEEIIYTDKDILKAISWRPNNITAAWEYEEIRDPMTLDIDAVWRHRF